MTRTISILIATYNRSDDLVMCLHAIANQHTSRPLQVCVVNDGGVSVAPIVRRFPFLDIRYLDLPENVGQVQARLRALQMASGAYVAFCDDDDRYLPSHLEGLANALDESGEDVVLAHSDAQIVSLGAMGGPASTGAQAHAGGRLFAWRHEKQLLVRYNPIVPSSVLYRRSVHEDVGLFDEAVSHYWDWDFFLRCNAAGRLIRVPVSDTLYRFEEHGTNQSLDTAKMQPALQRFTRKHNLGNLPVSNFWRMLDDPALEPFRAQSRRVWNGSMDIFYDDRILRRSTFAKTAERGN